MITLRRAQIRRDQDGIDITAKSAKGLARKLAPPWDLVMGLKRGLVSEREYTEDYLDQLRKVFDPNGKDEVLHFLIVEGCASDRDEVTFLCYCRDGWFCHTYLLIDFLVHRYPDSFKRG